MRAFIALGRAAALGFAIAPSALLAQAPGRDTSASILSYRTVEVAKGIYAFITPEERTGFQSGNSIAIIGDSAVLVFDVGAIPSTTRRQISELRRLTAKPVRYVVNSHWHPDHNLANGEYRNAYPGVRFIGSAATKQGIIDRAPVFKNDVKGFARSDSLMRLRLSTGKMRDGSDMPADIRVLWGLTTRDYGEFKDEVASAEPVTSDSIVDDSVVISLGGRGVRLFSAGRANTAGDLYAYVPDAGVLLTGDLVTVPCPFPSTAYFADWIVTLDRLEQTGARRIVPGHGEVQTDFAYVRLTRELLAYTLDQARDAVRRGLTAEQMRAAVSFDAFLPRLAGDDVVRRAAFDGFYRGPAIDRAFLEATLAKEGKRAPVYP